MGKDNKTLHIRKAARPESWHQVIYQALNLSHNPGGVSKTIIPDKIKICSANGYCLLRLTY